MTGQARRAYLSRVRVFLARLALADGGGGGPLIDPNAAAWAARDYRPYLYGTLKRAPATVNAALAAVSDLAIRHGLGKLDGQAVALTVDKPRGNARSTGRGCRDRPRWWPR
jgi:hypothetical protein